MSLVKSTNKARLLKQVYTIPSEYCPSESHILHLVFLDQVLPHLVFLHLVLLHLLAPHLVLLHLVLSESSPFSSGLSKFGSYIQYSILI